MLVNSDFSRRAIVPGDRHSWVASPQQGVSRVMLDRIGGEVARATSIVRYAPGSNFPSHDHPAGEEILVLSGTFSDEGGDYRAGWYLRNPPGSSHRPSSAPGATIFVKLRQMRAAELTPVRIDTLDPAGWSRRGEGEVCVLFDDGTERVELERLPAGARLSSAAAGDIELLVVEGTLVGDADRYPRGSWLRLPPGDGLALCAGAEGATLYAKRGHLRAPESGA